MTVWLQHLLAFVAVAACVVVVALQTARTLFGRGGGIGQCCAKGCAGHLERGVSTTTVAKPQASSPAAGRGERVVFLPVEMLTARKR